MRNIIKFEIVTPEHMVLKDEVVQVTLPTSEGEISILPNHIPLVATLETGVLEIVKEGGLRDIISVSGGFVQVVKDKVVVLVDTAERAEELDVDRLNASRKKAEESVKDIRHFDHERFASINAQLAKELARTRALKRWKKLKNIN